MLEKHGRLARDIVDRGRVQTESVKRRRLVEVLDNFHAEIGGRQAADPATNQIMPVASESVEETRKLFPDHRIDYDVERLGAFLDVREPIPDRRRTERDEPFTPLP